MKVDVECAVCGKIFPKERKQVNEAAKLGYSVYCSRLCQKESKQINLEVECANCGIMFKTKPWVVNKSKTGNVYCSRSCATTQNNKLFKWGGIAYEEALERSGHSCEACGYSNENFLKFYHKDGNRFNTDLDNIAVLCPTHLAETEHEMMFGQEDDNNVLTY